MDDDRLRKKRKLNFNFDAMRNWPLARWALLYLVPAVLVAAGYYLIPTPTHLELRVKLQQSIKLADAKSLQVLTVVDSEGVKRYVNFPLKVSREYDDALNFPGVLIDEPSKVKSRIGKNGVPGYKDKFDKIKALQDKIPNNPQAQWLTARRSENEKLNKVWQYAVLLMGCIALVLSSTSLWVRRVGAIDLEERELEPEGNNNDI